MKNSKRKFIAWGVLLVMCLAFFLTGCAPAGETGGGGSYNMKVTDATSDFYVNDFAGVFTAEQKTAMMANAVSLDEEYSGIQVVVTTVESLEGCVKEKSALQSVNVETVAYSMFLQYGIGQDDMGILVLFSTGDREVRIETGRQMQNYITDSKSGQILDNYGMDYFRNDQFAEGLVAVQNAVISEIKSVVPQDWNAGAEEEVTRGETVKPTEPTKVDNVIPAETQNGSAQSGATSDKSEEDGTMGWIAAFFAAIVAFIGTLGVSMKKIFSVKDDLEQSHKALNTQKKEYESQIAQMRAQQSEREEALVQQKANECSIRLSNQKAEAQKQEDLLRSKIESQNQQITKKNQELFDKSKRIIALEEELGTLKDKFTRVQKLHPDCDFEAEVKKMIEDEFRAEAQKLDGRIAECINLPADKDRVKVFANAMSIYDSAKPEVAKYLKSDRAKLKTLFDESNRLLAQYEKEQQEKRERAAANKAYEEIHPMVEGIKTGTYQTYDALSRAMVRYNKLSSSEKGYFPNKDLIKKVEIMLRDATTDRDNRNRAKSAENDVQRAIGYISTGSESDMDKLNSAMHTYKQLSYAQQAYFAADLLRKLERLTDEANEDHRRQEARRRREAEERRRREEEERRRREEEERRRREEARRRREEEERRRRMMSSSSSSFGGSSFGGHGGRPSGGGASRRF